MLDRLKATACRGGGGLPWLDSSAQDHLARATVVMIFALLVFANVYGGIHGLFDRTYQSPGYTLLQVAARLSNALFLALVVVTTLTRLRPIQKAPGLEPRASALLGTFMLMTLPLLPRPELPPILLATSSILVVIGMTACFMVLRWLGKSFSIMAEARRLITRGPYAIVRHPLYICEEIAVIGILIQVMSPVAFLIVVAHALVQFRRMLNEEKILTITFVEYESYAARTPRVIPFGWRQNTRISLPSGAASALSIPLPQPVIELSTSAQPR
jgi:protein-S-isoprenylcysteine O-methyltransferase Ste14